MRTDRVLFLIATVTMVAAVCAYSGPSVQAQTLPEQKHDDSNISANGVIGEVKVIDLTAKQIIVKTDAGSIVTVALSEKTSYLRLAPGEKTLTNASKITLGDIGEGDRVWARGKVTEDRKSLPAVALVVMSKVDIAKKQEQERAEWRRRGILGIVTSLKPESREITISTRSLAGPQSVVIPVAENVELRRYAPDSIKFNDAKPSEFGELQVGDQLRALGERCADGTHFAAERIVSGAFRIVAGTVTGVDAVAGEIRVNDLEKKQPLTILVKQDAVLRKFPSAVDGSMPMFSGPSGSGRQEAGSDHPARRETRPGGFSGAGSRGNLQDWLERLPTIDLTDIKSGDTIIVSSTKGADPVRLTAISLISGADTLLSLVASRQQPAQGQTAPNSAAGLPAGIQFGIGLP